MAGPELARWSKDWFAPIFFAGGFVAIAGLQAAALVLVRFLDIPPLSVAERASGGRPMLAIMREPAFVVAVLAGMIAYATMNFVMTATPLAMAACGHSFDATKLTMQIHVLGMFVPSFFTGHLIRRFGLLPMMLAGAVLTAACIGINATGVGELQFNTALLLLGVGWNFLYVGASTLLTEVPAPSERNKVQAANDFLVFGLVSVSAWSSGAMHEWLGWQPANFIVLPLIAVAALATLCLMRLRRLRPTPAQ